VPLADSIGRERSGCSLTLRRCVAAGRGETCRSAARALACPLSTISFAVRPYREEDWQGLTDRRTSNGEAKVDEHFLAALERVLKGTPED
jgi:hypothetical protein